MKTIETIFIHPCTDRPHYKFHLCQGICTDLGNEYSIELLQTKRWFDAHKFLPTPGDQFSAPETDRSFTITSVSFKEKRPKHAVFSAILNEQF